jgi:protoporphyrinogen oxidase
LKRTADIVIIGGGFAGLTLARKLGTRAAVLEREGQVGGLCRSFVLDGFLFDYGGHILHGDEARFQSLGGPELLPVTRRASIAWQGRRISYPFQVHAGELPEGARRECISAFLQRRPRGSSLDDQLPVSGPFASHYDALLASYGEGFVRLFFVPYHAKLMGCHLRELDGRLGQCFVPATTVRQVLSGAFQPHDDQHIGYNVHGWYPQAGGMQALVDYLHARVGCVETQQEVTAIDLCQHRLRCGADGWRDYRRLVSTMPLPDLLTRAHPVPAALAAAARRVRARFLWLVAVAAVGDCPVNDHWRYICEEAFPFHRVVFPGNIAPSTTAPGTYSLLVESAIASDAAPSALDGARLLAQLTELRLLRHARDATVLCHKRIGPAYVVPSVTGDELARQAAQYFAQYDVTLAGRYGTWDYLSLAEILMQTEEIADELSRT